MVFKFRILSDEVDDFCREIAIDSEATFLDLHNAILESVGYTADQMTSFFICNDEWEKGAEVTLIEMDSSPDVDSWVMDSTPLYELIEDEGQKLLYVFDYLTERAFFLETFGFLTAKRLEQPKCLLSEGEPPVQVANFDESSLEVSSSKLGGLDEDFYGDQDFDMDELDADGFTGLDEVENNAGFSTEF
jgi:hypothetical protein